MSKDGHKAWSAPFLRWAGSKRQLLPTLMRAWIGGGTYFEPFAGSACLFFALKPSKAVLGDINKKLMDVYMTVRQHPRLVYRALVQLPSSSEFYYEIRDKDHSSMDPIGRAAAFIYLNRNCFNGVYRTNKEGKFNVPRGRNTGSLPSEALIYRCSIALRASKLLSADFFEVIDGVSRNDFVYLDPPYSTSSRRAYGEYGYGSFEKSDLGRLESALKYIDSVGAKFLLSYADSSDIEPLKKEWNYTRVQVRRNVSGFSSSRRLASEVVISNSDLGKASLVEI